MGSEMCIRDSADANFLHQQIADSQVVVLSASHLSNIEAPAAFNAALNGFLLGEQNGR